jgi:hypothetical protein
MTRTVEVQCSGDRRVGWTCFVAIRERDRVVSEHEVRVAPADLTRFGSASIEPTDLVARSFAILLEREPPTSILRSFNLDVIGQFFPGYETEIRRVSGG